MATFLIRIVGDAKHFERELQSAESGTQRFGKAAGIAGLAIAGGLAFGLEKSVKAAMEAQTSTARLDQAFKDAGLSATAYSGQIDKAEASGRKLGFTDTATREALGSLLTATRNYGTAVSDLSVVQDVSRFKGVALADASKMVTMAMTGSQRAAKQLGITVIPLTTNVDKLKAAHVDLSTAAGKAELAHAKLLDKMATGNAVIDAVKEHIHGQAKAFAGTAAGGMQQFHAQLDHLEVKMGKGLLPAITKVVEKLSAFADFLSKHTILAQSLAIGFGVLAAALIGVSFASGIAAIGMSAFWIAATGGLILAIPVIAAGVILVVKHFDTIKTWVMHNWPIIIGVITGGMGFAVAEIIHHWSTIAGVFTGAFNTVKGVATAGWNAIKSAFTSALSAIESVTKSVWDKVVALFHGAVSGIRSAVSAVVGALGPIISTLQTIIGWVGRAVSAISHLGSVGPHVGAATRFGGAFGGGHAAGGPVSAGTSYLVGERGPELFTAGGDGFISPNSALGGGGGLTVILNIGRNYGDADQLAREVAPAMLRELYAHQLRGGLVVVPG